MNCKSFNLIRTGIFALPVIALSLMPAQAEIGQRNVYRDTAGVSVKDGSAEFVRIYTAGQAAALPEQSKAKQLSQNATLPSVSQSKEFGGFHYHYGTRRNLPPIRTPWRGDDFAFQTFVKFRLPGKSPDRRRSAASESLP